MYKTGTSATAQCSRKFQCYRIFMVNLRQSNLAPSWLDCELAEPSRRHQMIPSGKFFLVQFFEITYKHKTVIKILDVDIISSLKLSVTLKKNIIISYKYLITNHIAVWCYQFGFGLILTTIIKSLNFSFKYYRLFRHLNDINYYSEKSLRCDI